MVGLRELEADWRKDVAIRLTDWRKEMGIFWIAYRWAALLGQVLELRESLKAAERRYKSINNIREQAIIGASVLKMKAELDSKGAEMYWLGQAIEGKGRTGQVTDGMIEQARAADIRGLFPHVDRDKVLCPFHDDHKPSATVKGGFFHCFVCNESHDAISLLMKRDGIKFHDAIKRLSGVN